MPGRAGSHLRHARLPLLNGMKAYKALHVSPVVPHAAHAFVVQGIRAQLACMAHVLHADTSQGMCAQHSKQGACAACWRLALNKEKLQLWPFSSLESEQLP